MPISVDARQQGPKPRRSCLTFNSSVLGAAVHKYVPLIVFRIDVSIRLAAKSNTIPIHVVRVGKHIVQNDSPGRFNPIRVGWQLSGCLPYDRIQQTAKAKLHLRGINEEPGDKRWTMVTKEKSSVVVV